ncbi:hypothetical protein BLNAU_11063 [Blattamonas nauphoetae]|uniref:Uncharacterized protein n=1 Tax=Blattamonas nauphoetae TaxID=2049346 RepID=A0ABQ9XNF9_9EUKA|nr:hypothetical protein BLNAU_11063 [Blattamonas nauphoetae]
MNQPSVAEIDLNMNRMMSIPLVTHQHETSVTQIYPERNSSPPILPLTHSDICSTSTPLSGQQPLLALPQVKPDPHPNETRHHLESISKSVSVSPYPSEASDDANSSYCTQLNHSSPDSDRSSQVDAHSSDSHTFGDPRWFSLPTSPNHRSSSRQQRSVSLKGSDHNPTTLKSQSTNPVELSPSHASPKANPQSSSLLNLPSVDQPLMGVHIDKKPNNVSDSPIFLRDPPRFAVLGPTPSDVHRPQYLPHQAGGPKLVTFPKPPSRRNRKHRPPNTSPPIDSGRSHFEPQKTSELRNLLDDQNHFSEISVHSQANHALQTLNKQAPQKKFQILFRPIPEPIPIVTIPFARTVPPSTPSQARTAPNYEQIIKAKNPQMLSHYLSIFPNLTSSERFLGTVMSTWNKNRRIAWLYSANFPDNVFCDLRKLPEGDIEHVCSGTYIRFSICFNHNPQSVFAADHPVVVFQ